jgi:hypothetical protein
VEARLAVHVALKMESVAQTLGSAEEHTGFRWSVNLADGSEDHIPVGATEVRGRAQTRDGILFGVRIVDHDVGSIIDLDLRSKVLILLVSHIVFR